jgi:microcystin-dependent protein
MSFFLVNQHSAIPPPGTVGPYIGGGSTANGVNPGDPDGWVICDGENRTSTDNRFKNLYSILNTYMGVNSNSENSITPPNLTSSFIYGQASTATTTKSTGGSDSVTLAANNIPSLTISSSATDSGHSHTITTLSNSTGTVQFNRIPNTVGTTGVTNSTATTNTGKANISVTSSYTNNNPQNVATLPPYTTMNYIMKY